MIDRRKFLGIAAGAGASLAITPELLRALRHPGAELIQRIIPSSGEKLPVVGLGFSNHAGCADPAALSQVLRIFVDNGGTFFDTNFANEQASQDAIMGLLGGFADKDKLFLSWRGYPPGPATDPAIVKAHVETSLSRIRVPRLDMVDLPFTRVFDSAHWSVLQEARKAGRIRYLSAGVGPTADVAQLDALVRRESIDFFSVAYAIDNRAVEETILPFAMERKIAVMVHFPLGGAGGQSCVSDKGLFERVANTPFPEWAAEFDARSWAQFFLKYVISHPAVTVVRTGTTKPHHMLDNLAAGAGRLPDEAMRKRMAAFIDDIPLAVPPHLLERYVGEYKATSGLTVTVRRDGDRLFVKTDNSPEIVVIASAFRRFSDRQGSIFEFQITGVGPASAVTSVILEKDGQKITLEKK